MQEGNKYDNSASLPFQVAGEAIADIGTNLSNSDVEAALDLGTPELTSSDSTLELAGAPSLFASTIPAPVSRGRARPFWSLSILDMTIF